MRPIDADALKNYMAEKYVMYDHTFDDIDAQPTIDAVPVVRCKECKYGTYYHGIYGCEVGLHDGDFFCADGERREEDA